MRILLTDGNYKHCLGAARSLASNGHVVDVIGPKYCLARYSKFVNRLVDVQDNFNEERFHLFLKFLEIERYDVLMPIGAKSVLLVSKHRDLIEPFVHLAVAAAESISICMDKFRTANFAKSIGISVPRTWEFRSLDELKENISSLDYPLVLKNRSETHDGRPFYVNSEKELRNTLDSQMFRDRHATQGVPVLQEYIDGVGVGFFASYKNGEQTHYFMHQRIREVPPTGGSSCCAISIQNPKLREYGTRILDALKWHGVAMVEFKEDIRTGHLYLLEINPKFWGSLELAIASGVDFPLIYAGISTNRVLPSKKTYIEGLKYHWPLNGEVVHLVGSPSSSKAIVKDIMDNRVRSNILFSDPLPALHSFLNEIRLILKQYFGKTFLYTLLYRIRRNGLYHGLIRVFSESMGLVFKRFCVITPGIWVGSQMGRLGSQFLARSGVTLIVNLRDEYDYGETDLWKKQYCYYPIPEYSAPSTERMRGIVKDIVREVNGGGKVYIHCREGVGRAPLIACAYLIDGGVSASSAYETVKLARPFIDLSMVQMGKLDDYAAYIDSTRI